MLITGMRTKYYLLSVVAFVVAFVVLALLPTPAQAQEAPSIDKECTPNPVQVGQQITCTIDMEAAPGTGAIATVTDMVPAGLTVTEATFQSLGGILSGPCTVADNNVTCPAGGFLLDPIEVTIEATAQQCGTFENTATAEGFVFPAGGGSGSPFSIQSEPEQITVVGCEEAGGGGAGGGGAGGGGAGGGATPITQEGEQESEAGEIDQTFDVS